MKKAIVYYSLTGNTDYVAKKIAEKIKADLIKIEVEKNYPDKGFRKYFWCGKSAVMGDSPKLKKYDFKDYDLVIFGTPVWASNFTPPLRTFINENREKLANKKISVFTCFSGGGADKAILKLKSLLGIDKFEHELILVDPLDKRSEENEKKIAEFIKNML